MDYKFNLKIKQSRLAFNNAPSHCFEIHNTTLFKNNGLKYLGQSYKTGDRKQILHKKEKMVKKVTGLHFFYFTFYLFIYFFKFYLLQNLFFLEH